MPRWDEEHDERFSTQSPTGGLVGPHCAWCLHAMQIGDEAVTWRAKPFHKECAIHEAHAILGEVLE